MPLTGFVCDETHRRHDPGPSHPERPSRVAAVLEGVAMSAPGERLVRIPARDATAEDLALVHTPEYIDLAQREIAGGAVALSTGDTDVCAGSWAAAVRAAGGVLAAVDAVMAGTVRNAFAAVRPPGHHASADVGMGFCVFNNVAIAARHAQRRRGVGRVLIADWDVHHGNGTQAIFYDDPTVFFFSSHQWPLYPGSGRASETGAGAGAGYTLNCPLAAGSGGREALAAFREKLVPAMRAFRPEFVLVSAGFDSRVGDPLGSLHLTDDDFAALTGIVMDLAAATASGRLVSVLEGGYALSGLAAAAGAHVRRLTE